MYKNLCKAKRKKNYLNQELMSRPKGLYLTHTTRNYTAVRRSFAALWAAHKLLLKCVYITTLNVQSSLMILFSLCSFFLVEGGCDSLCNTVFAVWAFSSNVGHGRSPKYYTAMHSADPTNCLRVVRYVICYVCSHAIFPFIRIIGEQIL